MVGVLTARFCWTFPCHANTANHQFHMLPGKYKYLYQAESHFIDHESLPLLDLADC